MLHLLCVPQKVSPRAIRQLKTTCFDSDSESASSQGRTPSPKVTDRRSPRSPASEKKRPSKISELETQISVLQEELKRANEQLSASESWKKQALEYAEESKKQISVVSLELEESQKQFLQVFVGEEDHTGLNEPVLEEQDRAWQLGIRTLKGNLTNAVSLVENMKSQMGDSKGSGVQALASEALVQLESAKKSVEALRTDGIKATEAYNGLVAELERSKVRVNLLEGLVSKLKGGIQSVESERPEEADLRGEICSLKAEVGRLRSILEASEAKSCEQMKSVTNFRMSLIDKETELQHILKENSMLKSQLGRVESERGRLKEKMVVELEKTRASEKEALLKLGMVMEEADKSSKKVARVTEQLEAAQAANFEMESELRRLKVQSDQWRKAAEAAAAMLSEGNSGKFMDRTASLDGHYGPIRGKLSPFDEDMDEDVKKRNGSMLKKFGVLWKK